MNLPENARQRSTSLGSRWRALASRLRRAISLLHHCLRWPWQRFVDKRTIVIVLSSMRSGSTLLKALLGEADDVSRLPEVNYRRLNPASFAFCSRAARLASERIIVLKAPHWFSDAGDVRRIPSACDVRVVVLVRDVAETVCSLKRMIEVVARQDGFPPRFAALSDEALIDYWSRAYRNILLTTLQARCRIIFVRYEDLVADPLRETERLFRFVGSHRSAGTSTYRRSKNVPWQWGTDDGSAIIRTLTVQRTSALRDDEVQAIRSLAARNPEVRSIRESLGYLAPNAPSPSSAVCAAESTHRTHPAAALKPRSRAHGPTAHDGVRRS